MALQTVLTDIHDDIEWTADKIATLENLGSYVGTQVYNTVPTNLTDLQPGAGVNDFFTVEENNNYYRYIITDITAPTFVSVQDIQYSNDVSNKVDITKSSDDTTIVSNIDNNGSDIQLKVDSLLGSHSAVEIYDNHIELTSYSGTGSGSLSLDAGNNQAYFGWGPTDIIIDGPTAKAYYGSVSAGNEIAKKSDIGSVDITNKVDKILQNASIQTEIINDITRAVMKVSEIVNPGNHTTYIQDKDGISMVSENGTDTVHLLAGQNTYIQMNVNNTIFDLGLDYIKGEVYDDQDGFGVVLRPSGLEGFFYKEPESDESYVQRQYITTNCLLLSGNQTINGAKTFTTAPIIPATTEMGNLTTKPPTEAAVRAYIVSLSGDATWEAL